MPIWTFMHEVGGPEATKKELRQAKRTAFMKAAAYWHANILPLHFETSAVRRYNYTPRTAAYQRRKARVKHHQKPLIWSGQAYLDVRSKYRIKGTQAGGAQVIMSGPRHLYAYWTSRSGPNKAAEITANTREEELALGQMIEEEMTNTLNRVQTRTARRIA